MRPDRLRVVVSGMVAGVPGQGGATWAVLQWVLGLRELGHDVLLLEEVDALTDPRCAYFADVVAEFGLEGRGALMGTGTAVSGLTFRAVESFCRDADLIFNLAGTLRRAPLLELVPTRVYVDLDPGFTQAWHSQGIDMGFDAHTHFVTVGLNVGQPVCLVPTCGIDWITTLPPVVLSHWQPSRERPRDVWTTVASWRGYGSPVVDGVRWGQKAHSWRTLIDLPRRTDERLLPALAIHPGDHKDIAALEEHGWRWRNSARVAATPDAYRRFIASSKGELCIAKEGYVVSRSGWFSDRSACYLASGRPVIAQDTGLTPHLATGVGLMVFDSVDTATHALSEVSERLYPSVARELAESLLGSTRVLPQQLDAVSRSPRGRDGLMATGVPT